MEFSLASLLILLTLSGLASAIAGKVSDPLDDTDWFGNIGLVIGLAVCVPVSLFSPGLALLGVMVVAAFAGGYGVNGLTKMQRTGDRWTVATFIFAPLISVASVALFLTGIYLLVAFIFARFPLPFELPYSAVSSLFGFLFQSSVRLWEVYALCAYFSITGAAAMTVYWSEIKAAGKNILARRSPASSVAPGATPGTND